MPVLKKPELEAQLCDEGEKVIFIDNKPNIPTMPGIVQVVYVAKDDNTYDVWLNNGDEDPKKAWRKHLRNVKPKRAMAAAHYDEMRWSEFKKAENKRRKAYVHPYDQDRIRRLVRYFYDLQKLRIQSGNRDSEQAEPAVLEDDDKEFLGSQSLGLNALERTTLAEIEALLNRCPVYTEWLKHQPGVGPTISGVLIGEIDIGHRRQRWLESTINTLQETLADDAAPAEDAREIRRRLRRLEARLERLKPCDTPSALWAYAGLAVNPETGQAVRHMRGKVSNWNPFLKAKIIFVLGGCLLKAKSPWTKFYYDYKNRKQNELVPTCMLCEGAGTIAFASERLADLEEAWEGETDPGQAEKLSEQIREIKKTKNGKGGKGTKCYNCNGKGTNVPWGRGDKHRHQAAVRYMVKMFLQAFWLKWRELEGLPVTEPYAVAVLHREHGDHGGTGVQSPTKSSKKRQNAGSFVPSRRPVVDTE